MPFVYVLIKKNIYRALVIILIILPTQYAALYRLLIFTFECTWSILPQSRVPASLSVVDLVVSHVGFPSPFGTIPCVLHREPQVLHVVLDDFGPSLSLSSSTPLSVNVCLEDSFDTAIFFAPLYMPIPSQPGLAYLVCDTCYSNDTMDVIIPFPVVQGKTKDPA